MAGTVKPIPLPECYIVQTGEPGFQGLEIRALLPDDDDTWTRMLGATVSVVECGGVFLVTGVSASELLPLQAVTLQSKGPFTWPGWSDVARVERGPLPLTVIA